MTRPVIGVLGAGRMGHALAGALDAAGWPVLVSANGCAEGDRRPPGRRPLPLTGSGETLQRSAVVVLALPLPVALHRLRSGLGGDGHGRVLIDVTNPGITTDGWTAGRPGGSISREPVSGGEQLAAEAPTWRVAKAFNTVSARLLDECPLPPGGVTLPVASDHPSAVRVVAALATSIGLETVPAGGISAAAELEALALLLHRIGAVTGLGARTALRVGAPEALRCAATGPTGGFGRHPIAEPAGEPLREGCDTRA